MRNLFVLAICTCFTLLLFLTPCQGADRYPIQINFNKNTAAVKVFKRDKKAHVKLKRMTQENANFVRLTVDPATPTPAAITRELNLIPGKNNILRISMTCRTHNLERGHAKMVVYALGGKLPGNRVWHLTAMPLDTSDWVTASYAHALCFAGNWPELISEPIVNIAVLHDLESPFFGSLMYNVKFKPNLRQFDWIDLNEVPPVKSNKPMPGAELKKTFYFPNTYVPMSTTRVTAMLSQMVGSKITRAPSNNARQLTGNLIGLKDNKVYLFICNPTGQPQRARLNLPTSIKPLTQGTWQSLQADHVYAVLESEYRQTTQSAPNMTQTNNHLLLPAYSVNLFIYE